MTPLFRLSGTSNFGDAAEEAKHAHMRAGPIRQLLRPGRLGISEVRSAEHADKYLSLVDFARRRINNRDPLARVVHERLFSGDVVLAHHRAQPSLEPAKQIAEPAVAVALLVDLPIFLPQDHHRHARPLQLARQGRPIRLDPTPLAGLDFRRARTAAAPERRRSRRPPAATPVPPLPPVSDCPGPSTAPRPDVARSRARSPRRGEVATDVAIVACSVPASPASPSPRRPSTGGECLGC